VGTCDNVKIDIKVNQSKLYMDKILTHVIDNDDCEDPNTRLRDMGMTQFMERPFHQSGVSRVPLKAKLSSCQRHVSWRSRHDKHSHSCAFSRG
jgi:hypothetical protein